MMQRFLASLLASRSLFIVIPEPNGVRFNDNSAWYLRSFHRFSLRKINSGRGRETRRWNPFRDLRTECFMMLWSSQVPIWDFIFDNINDQSYQGSVVIACSFSKEDCKCWSLQWWASTSAQIEMSYTHRNCGNYFHASRQALANGGPPSITEWWIS